MALHNSNRVFRLVPLSSAVAHLKLPLVYKVLLLFSLEHEGDVKGYLALKSDCYSLEFDILHFIKSASMQVTPAFLP